MYKVKVISCYSHKVLSLQMAYDKRQVIQIYITITANSRKIEVMVQIEYQLQRGKQKERSASKRNIHYIIFLNYHILENKRSISIWHQICFLSKVKAFPTGISCHLPWRLLWRLWKHLVDRQKTIEKLP